MSTERLGGEGPALRLGTPQKAGYYPQKASEFDLNGGQHVQLVYD